jgi:phosphoribosylaminoimidazolecarboxamide formyltransferase/IMP cyclohydrolase
VRYIAEPGGSIRSADVLAACQEHGIALAHTGIRLFHH